MGWGVRGQLRARGGGEEWVGAPNLGAREGKGRAPEYGLPEVGEVSLESHLIVESQCVWSLVTVVTDCVIWFARMR